MHKQEFEVRIQNGKKLIEEAIALTSGGGTKVPWEFFRYWLGKKQKGYNSRRFYLMENGENFYFSTTEGADGREDLKMVVNALVRFWLTVKLIRWVFVIPKFDDWVKKVASKVVGALRIRAPLRRFELYVLIPRDEIRAVEARVKWLRQRDGYKNPFRVNHFHGEIALGEQRADLYCYHVAANKFPQDFGKLEIGVSVGSNDQVKNLFIKAANELNRLCEGVLVAENPKERTGVALFGGPNMKEDLNVTYELRGGLRALRKQRINRSKAPTPTEPQGDVTTGIKVLDQAFGPRGVSPGLYRFVLAAGSDLFNVKLHKVVQRIVDAGHTAVCVIEGAMPCLSGPEDRIAMFTTYQRKRNNHVDRSGTERMIDWWLTCGCKPSLLYVELTSAPHRDDFWLGLGERAKRAGVPLFLVYPCETKRRNFLDTDVFCLRVDELVRQSHTATRSYVSVRDYSHVTIEFNQKTGRKAHSLKRHELRFHQGDSDAPGWCPRRVPTVRFNPHVEYKGLLL